MSTTDLAGSTAVVAVARDGERLEALRAELGDRVTPVVADAAGESKQAGLGIRIVSILPTLTAETELGAAAVAGYARQEGIEVAEKLRRMGPTLRPEHVGKHLAALAGGTDHAPGAYLLSIDGLKAIC